MTPPTPQDPVDISALEKAAEKATPGTRHLGVGGLDDGARYVSCPHEEYVVGIDSKHGNWEIISCNFQDDAKFLALCSPQTILALVAVAKAAKEIVCEVRDRNPSKIALVDALQKLTFTKGA